MPTIHLIIKGRVQGVFYRTTAKDVANKIGITGWVKNTVEGNVELMATGSKDQLEKLIEWCKVGPGNAIVTEIVVTDQNEESFKGFEVLRR